MYCIKCGTKLDDKTKFCTSCGYKIEKNNRNINWFGLKNSFSKKILTIGLVGCLLILACFVTKQIFFKNDNREDVIEDTKADSVINNERADNAASFDGTSVNDISVPTSFEDALVQFGLFKRNIAAERNAAETLDEFEDTDKLDIQYLVNNGKCWYMLVGDSVLRFNPDGTFKENEYWGNGEYSIRKDFTLKIDENDEAYKRVVSKGTIILSCDIIGNKEIYQYILYSRKENPEVYRMVMVDAVANQIAYIYDSDLDGADYDIGDVPGFRYDISFDYDLSNPYGIEDDFYTYVYNVILYVDKYLRGEETASKTLEAIEEIYNKILENPPKDDDYSILYKVKDLVYDFQQHINNPNVTINSSFSYKPINEIFVTRAELLNELGMQYFEYTRPYLD